MKKITFMGIPDCAILSNGNIEIVVTTQVGPRILCYREVGKENILAELPDVKMKMPLGDWHPYGGHRIWAAPEEMPKTYYPDNNPVEILSESDLAVSLRSPKEIGTNLIKQMTIALDAKTSAVTIDHTITNAGDVPLQLAVWSLTIMRGGGTTILPQEPYRSHDDYLLPARPVVLWYFTDLSDSRWKIGKQLIQLSTDDTLPEPQKIGILNKQGWAAYHREDTLFIKQFDYDETAIYPDYNCNNEAYTAGSFMELETLGPMVTLQPNESASHQERWTLQKAYLPDDESERAQVMKGLI